MIWVETHSHDPLVVAFKNRHYSRRNIATTTTGAIGAGFKVVLRTTDDSAVWAVHQRDPRGNEVFRCSIFRNEGARSGSDLVESATLLTFALWARHRYAWPGVDLRTEVDTRFVQSKNPGACFRIAGWRRVDGPPSAAKRRPYMLYFVSPFALKRGL